MKLAGFVPSLAHVLATDVVSTNVLAQHLRGAGLITSSGRGPGGAEMLPKDATNLVLATLHEGHAKDAPAAVSAMREWPMFEGTLANLEAGGRLVPQPIGKAKIPLEFPCRRLGEAMDGLFDALSFGRAVRTLAGAGSAVNGGLSLHLSRGFGHRLQIWLAFGDHELLLDYGIRSEGAINAAKLSGAAQEAARERLRQATGIEIVKRVHFSVLQNVANLLSMPSPDAKVGFLEGGPAPAKPAAKPKAKRAARPKRKAG